MSAKRKLLVTGANGFVAGSVMAQAGSEWELYALSRAEPVQAMDRVRWHRTDSSHRDQLLSVLNAAKPEVIIHTAAIADIDLAEHNRELARAVNVELTRALVHFCADTNCRLVFCSTDTVFDGEHAPYKENDSPRPVNYYGQTKLEAEESVQTLGERGMIARLALVMGLPLIGAGNSFLARMVAAFKEGRALKAP